MVYLLKEKEKEYKRKYYLKNREKIIKRSAKRYKKNKKHVIQRTKARRYLHKQRAIDYKGGRCQHCKNTFEWIGVYDFHHCNPIEKEKDITDLMGLSWEKILKEIDKCILLCANCHRIEHHRMHGERHE